MSMPDRGRSCGDLPAALMRRRGAALAACTGAIACLSTLTLPRPMLLWNASASMPRGLYAIGAAEGVGRGDTVVARLPGGPRRLAARRGYLPFAVPVIKRIAALSGDRVCARGGGLWVNGRFAAARRSADAAGRPLGGWRGCRKLGGEVLLLGDSARSFDSRYFGPIDRSRVVGRARLLWAP